MNQGPAPDKSETGWKAHMVAEVFAEILGQPSYPVDQSLPAAGATSLHAIRIAQRLSVLGPQRVPVIDVLRHADPRSLARCLTDDPTKEENLQAADEPELPHFIGQAEGPERWHLPSPQQRIWALHEREPDRLDHLVTVSLQLGHTQLPAQIFQDAWTALVNRHATLRMRVAEEPNVHAIADSPGAGLQYLDIASLPGVLGDNLFAEELDRLRRLPFDLRTGPVTRGLLTRHRGGSLTLDLVIHHIACDGVSIGILIDDLFQSCVQPSSVSPCAASGDLVPPYSDFAAWESRASQNWPSCLRRCADDLLPVPDPLILRHNSAISGDRDLEAIEVHIDKNKMWRERLQQIWSIYAYSPLVVGLVAVAVTLSRHCGSDVFYIAVPVANRPPGFESVVGDFVNTSIARMDLTSAISARNVLHRTAAQVGRIYETQDLPFEMLVSHLGAHASSVQAVIPTVALTVQNFERLQGTYGSGDLSVEWQEVAERQSKYDLVVTMDTIESSLSLTCSPQVLNEPTATAMLTRIGRAIDLITTDLKV